MMINDIQIALSEEYNIGVFHRPCPSCGGRAIYRLSGEMLTSDPPYYGAVWWCNCGWKEQAPRQMGWMNDDDANRLSAQFHLRRE